MTATAFDILVIGGGPAGVVTASLLARHGYRVALITKPRRVPAVEGLSERAMAGLRFAGCTHALASIGPAVQRQAEWNGARFEGNREWIVDRAVFDAALAEDARAAGVTWIGGHVTRLARLSSLWSATLGAGAEREWRAAFVVDARGRSAPHHGRLRRGPATIALGQAWSLASSVEPVTRVATFAEGWAWFAVEATGAGVLQLVVSTKQQCLPPRPRLESHYQALLARFPEARQWLNGARPRGPVFARYAHPQRSDEVLLDDGYARVGDAAFAIDPLSGHGVYEAIAGALALAATINTLLARPQDTAIAQRFYRERIEHDFRRMARIGRDFYRQEQRWSEEAFWRERQAWPDEEPAHASPASAPPRVEQRPVSVDGFIEPREVIVTADHPRGLWTVAGVPLVPLLRFLRDHPGEVLQNLTGAYAIDEGLNPQACGTAVAWLASRGLLRIAPGS